MKYCPECGTRVSERTAMIERGELKPRKTKRKLSAWNKFVKQNSSKPRFRYARSNKINLKKMAIAFRKTPAGKKKRR
jgi:DNA-directed RNA polymerase subunit M/transcription elongation factor TFIIS